MAAQPDFQPNPTFADLRNEFFARGFSYLDDLQNRARADNWLRQAYYFVCDADDWPFLYAEYGGAAPLSVPDLRTLLAAYDVTNQSPLGWGDAADIARGGPVAEGTPGFVYQLGSALNVYPRAAVELAILYVRFPTVPADTAPLVIPGRYSHAVVAKAVASAYRDDDSPELAAGADQEAQNVIEQMRDALMHPQRIGPDDWAQVYGHSDDWGGVADEQ